MHLTPIQEGTLVAEQIFGRAFYNAVGAEITRDSVDLEQLTLAIQRVAKRHDALSLTLERQEDGTVTQVPRSHAGSETIRELPGPASSPEAAEELIRQTLDEPWDLFGGPAWQLVLAKTDTAWRFVLAAHHLFSDAVSMQILTTEIAHVFGELQGLGPAHLPKAASFRRAAQDQLDRSKGRRMERGTEFWQELVAGSPTYVELFAPESKRSAPNYETLRVPLSPALIDELQNRVERWNVNDEAVALAATGRVLSDHGAGLDFLVTTPASTRMRRYGSPVVGMFANTTLRRVQVQANDELSASALFQQAQRTRAWQDIPYGRVLEKLRPPRAAYTPPLSQLSFHYGPEIGRAERVRDAGYEGFITWKPLEPFVGGFDLSVCFETGDEGPDLVLRADSTRVRSGEVRQLSEAIVAALSPARSSAKRRPPKVETADVSPQTTLDLMQGRADQSLAVIDLEGNEVSYQQLQRLIDGAAETLQEAAVGPGELVAVDASLTLSSIAATLACLRTGCAFFAMDENPTSARDAALASRLGIAGHLRPESPTNYLFEPAEGANRSHDPAAAMVIATSGSTGSPKALALSSANLESFVRWGSSYFDDSELDTVLATTSLRFDCVLFEVFLPLFIGKTVQLGSSLHDARLSPRFKDVTYVATTPTVLRSFLDIGSLPASIRGLTLSGEQCPVDLFDIAFAASGVESIRNMYGPAEATTYASGFVARRQEWDRWKKLFDEETTRSVPIGAELPGHSTIQIVLENGREAPVGVPGQLQILGPAVGLGYIEGAPEEPSFIADEAPLFRTGDRCLLDAEVGLRFLGRYDRQVKVRGIRVEPLEVEHAIRQVAGVKDCRVAPTESARSLRAIVEVGEQFTTVDSIRSQLAGQLPSYLVPSEFALVDALPTNSFGKAAAAELETTPEAHGPTGYIEGLVHDIFAQVLSVQHLSRFADFFDLGGDSLQMLNILALVEQRFGANIDVETFMNHSSVRHLATLMVSGGVEHSYEPLLALRTGKPSQALCYVHGSPGDLKFAHPLTQMVGTAASSWGLRAPGLEPGVEIADSVGELGETYANQIIERLSDSALNLVGYCSGGLIAIEVARLLAERDFNVNSLVLLHSPLPTVAGTGCIDLAAYDSPSALDTLVQERLTQLREDFEELGEERLIDEVEDPSLLPYFHNRIRVSAAIDLAAARYRPQRPICDVYLVTAEMEGNASLLRDGWLDVVGPSLRHQSLPTSITGLSTSAEVAAILKSVANLGPDEP